MGRGAGWHHGPAAEGDDGAAEGDDGAAEGAAAGGGQVARRACSWWGSSDQDVNLHTTCHHAEIRP
ncbi:MAG TPA: hypothetical protein ENK23_02435 [Sorangium sp.]|nr:hypothetical protein [Sorangium sp.]